MVRVLSKKIKSLRSNILEMPATSRTAQTALLFPFWIPPVCLLIFYDCDICSQRLMTLLFTRPLHPSTDSTPCHSPVPVFSSFSSGGANRSLNRAQKYSDISIKLLLLSCCSKQMVSSFSTTHSAFVFFLDYPNLYMYSLCHARLSCSDSIVRTY